jgi:predicted nucleic acid-binding protein
VSYLLDTDCVINALAGRRRAPAVIRRLAPQGIAVSVITLAEIYEAAFCSPNPQAHAVASRQFLQPLRVLNVNESIAERFAETRSHLRHRGELIPDFDILIAATALHYDLTLLTYNRRHFSRIPDLKLYELT